MKYVMRYAIEVEAPTDGIGPPLIDFFIKEGVEITNDVDEAMRFETEKEAWDYVNQFQYPYRLKTERVMK